MFLVLCFAFVAFHVLFCVSLVCDYSMMRARSAFDDDVDDDGDDDDGDGDEDVDVDDGD